MAERIILDDSVAREIEEQLFATLRQQTNRPVPALLPHKDFWERVAQLLDTIEMKVHEIYRTRGPDLRLQNLQKRQANIRRTASDLARKRLVAMLQHAASTSLRSEGGLQNLSQIQDSVSTQNRGFKKGSARRISFQIEEFRTKLPPE